MKTVMQELWEDIISDRQNIDQKTYVVLRKKIYPLIEIEKQQKEDFAIGFAEFLEGRDLYLEKITIAEAMEIYKKENGL